MATVEYDEILLNFSSKVDAKGLRSAVSSLEKLKSINGFSGLKQASEDLKDFLNALDGIGNKRMKTVTNLASALKGLGGVGKAMKMAKDIATNENPLNDTTMGEAQPPISLADMMKNFEVDITWKDILANAFDEVKAKGQKTFEDIKKSASALAEVAHEVKNAIASIGKAILNPIKAILGRFTSLIAYRIMRAIISGFTNGLKEGIKNLEDWDRNIGHTGFADSMDRARESLLVLKNALAVITAPALEWLIGVLQNVATWAITAANAISRFFAILGNKSTYRAVIWANTLADSEAKAGGSAKKATQEFKKQLMAFDEINNITAQNDSGSGGGGGSGSGAKYSEMFDEYDVGDLSYSERKWQNIFEGIKLGAEETQKSLKQRAEEFKRMWGNLLNDTGQWWDDWTKKLNVSWQVLANNMGHISKAHILSEKGDYEGAWNEIKQIFTGDMHEYEVAVQLYGKEWADTHYGVRTDFERTAKVWDEKLLNLTKATKEQTDAQGKHIKKNITDNLAEATKKGDETGGVFKKISDFAKKWLTPASITDPLTTPLANAKTNAEGLYNNLNNIGGKTFKPNIPTDGLTTAEREAVGLKGSLNDIQGTYKVTINTTENVTRTVTEVVAKTGGAGSKTSYQKYASGGYPTTGQLFIAREAGAELVGNIGGHTAVVNNADIVASVSQGVAQAVASVMGGGSNVTVTLEGDAKGIFKVVQKEGRAYSARTGQPALA